MRMSVQDDLRTGKCRMQSLRRGTAKLVSVGHYDVEAIELQHCNPRKHPAQLRTIGVAVHGRDWSESLQVAENTGFAHVAGVNDVIHTFEGIEYFRPQETVRVGDDTEAHVG